MSFPECVCAEIWMYTHINISAIPKRAAFSSLMHLLADEYMYIHIGQELWLQRRISSGS